MKTMTWMLALVLAAGSAVVGAEPALNQPPDGFVALFNGKNLDGWWGLSTQSYTRYHERWVGAEKAAAMRAASQDDIHRHWRVENGVLINDGKGLFLTTEKNYRDFELLVDYKTVPKADSGIYLRGIPQVQIWDYTRAGGKWKLGADKGSGGLWNNPPGSAGKDPLVLADKPFGQWNHFRIKMIGPYVNVWLNGKHVVKDAKLHNYFDRKGNSPIPADGPIQLQTHGGQISWRNLFIREIGDSEAAAYFDALDDEPGYKPIFNGRDFTGWAGPIDKNQVRDGQILSSHGTLYYKAEQYGDFIVRFQFKLPPGGNNGLAIRYPGTGDTAYVGMCECQVLDNSAPGYAHLHAQQYHGSIYGQVAARRGYLRPPNQWNYEKVTVRGHRLTVELNGTVITDADVSTLKPADFMYDPSKFRGRMRLTGYFGLAGHGKPVAFRDLKIKKLD